MNEIIGIAFGLLTVGGIIIYLGKILINKGFDAALKNFENNLEILKMEHQIRFSKLHEERADLLKKMYYGLYDLINALKDLVTSNQGPGYLTDTDRLDFATKKLRFCINLLERNRIFFPKDFCSKLEDNLEESRIAIQDWRKTITKAKREERYIKMHQPNPYKEGDTSLDWWNKIETKVLYDFEKNRKELADDFRKLIGVEIE